MVDLRGASVCDNQAASRACQCVSALLLNRISTHLRTCMLHCLFKCASPRVHVHTRVSLYVMRCICRPLWLHLCCRLPLRSDLTLPFAFLIIYSTFAVTTSYSLCDPRPLILRSHCLFGTKRIKSKWPRLFIFPPPVSDHICTLHIGPCLYAHLWSKIRQHKWILQRNS